MSRTTNRHALIAPRPPRCAPASPQSPAETANTDIYTPASDPRRTRMTDHAHDRTQARRGKGPWRPAAAMGRRRCQCTYSSPAPEFICRAIPPGLRAQRSHPRAQAPAREARTHQRAAPPAACPRPGPAWARRLQRTAGTSLCHFMCHLQGNSPGHCE